MTRKSEQILSEWLVLQAQSGKGQALNALARHWYPMLHRYASSCLGSGADAADAVQATLELTCRNIAKVRDPAAFSGWVYRILHRRCMDQLRKYPRGISVSEREPPEEESVHQDSELALQQDLRSALHKIRPQSYQVVHLYYLHDLPVQEIACILGVPDGTVKSRLHTARDQLKSLLGAYDE